ncbi:MAG: hypothetical protein KDA27_20140 [Candidatus Eisenbacteria bacterium]|uniref:Uncharacterized protein n=1 Tax=Eiseniibacteriota bacterium TaxID=2212470 RepID=A0A956NJ55_UNCEI|nr:hypothetical protein [Candidatus Eisenbacteria bacterium]
MPKAPKYQFESYLLHLRDEKDAAARALADAENERLRQEQILARLSEKTQALQADGQKWKSDYAAGLEAGAFSVQELGTRRDHLRRLDGDIVEARRQELAQGRAVQKAVRAEDEARATFQAKANEVQVHEDRKERWLQELKREELRKEQKQIEEISTARHERRRRDER